jgi:hypothetical protein
MARSRRDDSMGVFLSRLFSNQLIKLVNKLLLKPLLYMAFTIESIPNKLYDLLSNTHHFTTPSVDT